MGESTRLMNNRLFPLSYSPSLCFRTHFEHFLVETDSSGALERAGSDGNGRAVLDFFGFLAHVLSFLWMGGSSVLHAPVFV